MPDLDRTSPVQTGDLVQLKCADGKPLAIVCIVFPIIGGVKANNGEVWAYPLSLKIVK